MAYSRHKAPRSQGSWTLLPLVFLWARWAKYYGKTSPGPRLRPIWSCRYNSSRFRSHGGICDIPAATSPSIEFRLPSNHSPGIPHIRVVSNAHPFCSLFIVVIGTSLLQSNVKFRELGGAGAVKSIGTIESIVHW